MSAIEEAIEAHWGPRCPSVSQEPGCPCCDVWIEYDGLLALASRYDDAMKRIQDLESELEHLRREVNR